MLLFEVPDTIVIFREAPVQLEAKQRKEALITTQPQVGRTLKGFTNLYAKPPILRALIDFDLTISIISFHQQHKLD